MFLSVCPRRALAVVISLALTACTGFGPKQPVPLVNYQPEAFNASAFSRHYVARPARICDAARRALLSQGYVVTAAAAEQVTARKYFQPDAAHPVQLEFRVVCAPDAGDNDASTVFASGLKDQYVMRKAKNSASLGVGGVGSLSLPIEGGMDALVKVSSETVVDRALYERLFDLMSDHLSEAVEPPPPREAAASAPAPATPPPSPTIILLQSTAPFAPASAASAAEPLALPAASEPQPAASASQPAASASAEAAAEAILSK
jgi:hypothetical protein